MNRLPLSGIAALACVLVGCGTFTGIPSHGGGKRFAVEQELIAASARAAAKGLDVSPLAGRKCALVVTTIGDEGSGNLSGGRWTYRGSLRADYVDSATTRAENRFPSPSINYPSRSKTETEGWDVRAGGGVDAQWPPEYRSEAFVNPEDGRYLAAVLNEAMLLRGVVLVPPNEAEAFVYVTVDVFGTVRSRTELHVLNRERLVARTSLQALAVDRERKVVLAPRTSSFEAEYSECYMFWMGPVKIHKSVRAADAALASDPLADFRGITSGAGGMPRSTPEPPKAPAEGVAPEGTRPKGRPSPTPSPEPSRPEDVERGSEAR